MPEHATPPLPHAALKPRAARIMAALQAEFSPALLEVQDDSARHAGHAGASPEGETHFTVVMTAAAFTGLGRVERSRRVHAALQTELDTGLHALALRLRAPDEAS